MTAIDANAPLVLSVKSLGRRAGSMTTVERVVRAPGGWAVTSCEVREGAPIALRLRLESVIEGVLVSGEAVVRENAECSRCLDPIEFDRTVDLLQLYVYNDEPVGDDDPDEPLPRLEGELLDLQPVLRDAVVLDLPLAPVCRADCPGLCPECGAKLADDPDHRHDGADPRWAALQQWSTDAETPEAPQPQEGR